MLSDTKRLVASTGLWLLALPSMASAALTIASALTTIEYTPELIAIQDYFKNGSATITNGGVANLFNGTGVDLASNAETQALRQYGAHKNLRIIYTVAEVPYRLVASPRSGVKCLADLRGKKIATFPATSAAYFVKRMMDSAGVREGEYTVVTTGTTCTAAPCAPDTYAGMLASGAVDAFGMWEPHVQLAIDAVGSGAVIFQDKAVYREIFNLHSTEEKLRDPAKRREIVAFLRAMLRADRDYATAPDKIIPRAAKALGIGEDLLRAAFPVHEWPGVLPPDLLDVLVAEDEWVGRLEGRPAMPREVLKDLIDDSVLKEAMAG